MTATTTPTAPKVTVAHAAGAGGLVGVVATLAGLFDVPATTGAVQSNTTIFGPILVAVSVLGYILHRLGVDQATISTGETFIEGHLPQIEAAGKAVEQLPFVQQAISDIKADTANVRDRLAVVEGKANTDVPGLLEAVRTEASKVLAPAAVDALVGNVESAAAPPAAPAATDTAAVA